MSAPLPATLIAGFGGGGKAQVIDALLRHKPEHEQWALIAPAGLLGGARLAQAPAGLWVETVAPGCPCCTGLTPFSTGLVALLRSLRNQPVTRLLIEGGAEGHIASVARLLDSAQFRPHVGLAYALAVIDPAWLANPAPTARAALLELAGAAHGLIAQPWAESTQARAAFAAFVDGLTPPKPWTPLIGGVLDTQFAQAALPTLLPSTA